MKPKSYLLLKTELKYNDDHYHWAIQNITSSSCYIAEGKMLPKYRMYNQQAASLSCYRKYHFAVVEGNNILSVTAEVVIWVSSFICSPFTRERIRKVQQLMNMCQ